MSNPEIVSMMGALGYTLVKTGGEYHGNCPYCRDPEGEDRFVVFADGHAYCRICQNWWNTDKFRKEFFYNSAYDNSRKPAFSSTNARNSSVKIVSATSMNSLWSQSADDLINRASQELSSDTWGINELQRRGIKVHPDMPITSHPAAAGLGYIKKDCRIQGASWGITKEFIWIPQGLLIPTYWSSDEGPYCVKLKVRRQRIDDGLPKYIEISGSSKQCMVLGYHCSKAALIVESELDAILCMQEAEYLVWTVALGGASKPVDEETDYLLKKAPLILWALDQDEAGQKRYFAWRERYPQLRAWPADKAKSPGDMSNDKINSWLERGIKKYMEDTVLRL